MLRIEVENEGVKERERRRVNRKCSWYMVSKNVSIVILRGEKYVGEDCNNEEIIDREGIGNKRRIIVNYKLVNREVGRVEIKNM